MIPRERILAILAGKRPDGLERRVKRVGQLVEKYGKYQALFDVVALCGLGLLCVGRSPYYIIEEP